MAPEYAWTWCPTDGSTPYPLQPVYAVQPDYAYHPEPNRDEAGTEADKEGEWSAGDD